MKKFLLASFIVILTTMTITAKDIYSRNASDLPSAAQTVLMNNFKSKVSVIKIEKSLTGVSEYEVILSDGTEISFDREGNWKNVEVSLKKKVPDSIVPATILEYIKKNNKGKKIVGIEKNRNYYEVELENGIELKFDRAGNFKRYDD